MSKRFKANAGGDFSKRESGLANPTHAVLVHAYLYMQGTVVADKRTGPAKRNSLHMYNESAKNRTVASDNLQHQAQRRNLLLDQAVDNSFQTVAAEGRLD